MILKKIYRSAPGLYGRPFRNVYHSLLSVYLKACYILKYKNPDMFNDINIETTTLCNRRCDYCPNSIFDRSWKENEKLLPEDLFKKIIGDLKAINFTGRISPHLYGEPLLDRRLPALMRYAHEMLPKARTEIYTNADLLDMDILQELYSAGVRDYVITLHGNKEEKVKNKARVLGLKKKAREQQMKIIFDLIDLNDGSVFSNRGGLIKPGNAKKEISCLYPTNPYIIDYKGDVLLCCNDYLGEIVFGNVKQESVIDIWNKPAFRKIRKDLGEKKYTLDICRRCTAPENNKPV